MTDGAPGVWRLTFAYDGDDISLVDKQWVARRPPPPSDISIPDDATGFWVEVRGDDGTVLHQEPLREPVRRDVEVFSPEGTIERHAVDQPAGAFQVVVPDRPGADRVVLRRGGGAPPKGARAGRRRGAVDVITVGLHDGPNGKASA
jgi:hypothetical protein